MWLLLVAPLLAGTPEKLLIADSDMVEDPSAQSAQQAAWIAARQADRAPVALPISFRSMGWGCPCPDVFVGTSVGTFTTGPWLHLTYAEGLAPPEPTREGLIVVAEGHFTGQVKVEDLSPTGETIPDFIYQLQGFHVTAWRPHTGEADDWLRLRSAE